MRAADRDVRDDRVMWLFASGCSYRQIARVVGLRSPGTIRRIVRRELGRSSGRRIPQTEFGRAILVERTEALLRASWPAALAGDYAATEACLRLLDEQLRFYGLASAA